MKKQFQPDDMKYIRYLSGIAVNPQGSLAAWVNYKGDEETGLFSGQIHLTDLKDSAPQVLQLAGSCSQPQFLDDDTLLYLSDASGERQLYQYNILTQSCEMLTSARHGVNRYSLSRNGKKAVLEIDLWQQEVDDASMFVIMSDEEKTAWKEEVEYSPYEITDLTYKMDEWYGMRKGQLPKIAVLDIESGAQELLTVDGLEYVYPQISPDGSTAAFYGYPHTGAKGRQAELFLCDIQGGKPKQLTNDIGVYADTCPAFSEDGKEIVFAVCPMLEDGSTIILPYAYSLKDNKTRAVIGEEEDQLCHGLNGFPVGRSVYGESSSYFDCAKDDYLYFLSTFCGRESLYRKNLHRIEEPVELILAGETCIHEFAIAKEGSLVYLMANFEGPAEAYVKLAGTKEAHRLTDANPWLSDYELPKTEELSVKSFDGKADLQGWVMHPENQEKGQKYPAVLYIHGGPECTFTAEYWHEFHALAAAGMAVIFANPRGSVGYGRAFCAGGIAWAKEAMDDLIAVVQAACEKGFIDEKRIGVTGGSYGGYMTNKFIGRTNHFAAAVTQRSLINPSTSYGTGDMGFISARPNWEGMKMLDELLDRARGNAITYIDNMKVPLLILHGYKDYRCSFEQAEQLFIAMKDRNPGIPVRLVMFPTENHGVDRIGKLYNQIRHLSEMTDWFTTYLCGGGKHE
ncbi:S9 family peptidase [Emergencia sp. JLR.KK010]|uniref:alpha/beta hydrolase family protein n=1 Tax=Emergencia sp. JLR.KK010 TaxID=3114296 RepID=UPI0030D4FF59